MADAIRFSGHITTGSASKHHKSGERGLRATSAAGKSFLSAVGPGTAGLNRGGSAAGTLPGVPSWGQAPLRAFPSNDPRDLTAVWFRRQRSSEIQTRSAGPTA